MRERFFDYAMPQWCQGAFGAQLGTQGLVGLSKALSTALDLVPTDQWPTVQAAGVTLSCVLPDMGRVKGPKSDPLPPFAPGFNSKKHKKRVYDALNKALDDAAAAGIKFIIVFAGMDTGEARDVQFQRIVEGFTLAHGGADESLIEKAERLGITFIMEMLNTVGDEATWKGHPGYLGNATAELVEKVVSVIDSPWFKLAFDVYHITMMGEDVFAMIERYHAYIAYVHIAGVMRQADGHHPQNRGEITLAGQVVDYGAVCAKLKQYVPKGTYILFEWIPTTNEPAAVQAAIKMAIAICENEIGA